MYFLTVDLDMTFVREVDTAKHIHQGRFAGTIFTQQRKDLAAAELHVDFVIGDHMTKALGNIRHLDCKWSVMQWNHPFYWETAKTNRATVVNGVNSIVFYLCGSAADLVPLQSFF